MKKIAVLVFVFLFTYVIEAQNTEKELVKNTEEAVKILADSTNMGWKTKGNFSFLFNQSNFNNWLSGGENNLSGNVSINHDFNYKKKDWTWDNKVLASY